MENWEEFMGTDMMKVWYDQMVNILDSREFSPTEFYVLRQVADKVVVRESDLKDLIVTMWWLAELRFVQNDISRIDLSWSQNLKG
jgi:radical SAM superfamily enzyme